MRKLIIILSLLLVAPIQAQQLYRCSEGVYFWSNTEPCVHQPIVDQYKYGLLYMSGILAIRGIDVAYKTDFTCADVCPQKPVECPDCPICPPQTVCPPEVICPNCPICPPEVICPNCPICEPPVVCPEPIPCDKTSLQNDLNDCNFKLGGLVYDLGVCSEKLVTKDKQIEDLQAKVKALEAAVSYYKKETSKWKSNYNIYLNKYNILRAAFCIDPKTKKVTTKCKLLGVPG